MAKKIVFINQATGYLTIDVINEFVKKYDEVALICGSVRVQDDELDSKVKVSKIALYNRGSNIKKALSWLWGTIQIYFLLKIKYRNHEVFFYTIPPTAYLLASKIKTSFSILIYDLYPNALKIKGMSENSRIYSWWSGKNKKIFSKAKCVFTISDRLKQEVQSYSPSATVKVIPNWSAFSGRLPIPKVDNAIIKREGLHRKFVVQYSGNIGVTHNVEMIVELAESLKDHSDIEFLIIGRGERVNVISELILKKDLKHCQLLPYRDDSELFESLCVPDIAVVTLDEKVPDISVPSKTYNILSAGVPILAIAAEQSSIAKIISEDDVGKVFNQTNIKGMREFILYMKENVGYRNKIAVNALKSSEKYTKANAMEFLEELI